MAAVLAWLRRRWLLIAVVVASVLFVVLNLQELQGLLDALIRGQWQWVLAAALSQTAYYLLYTLQYQYAFAAVEVASRVLELLPVLFASIFLRTIVPSGGVSGAALFIDDANRRGQSGARAAEGALLVLALDLSTLLPILLAAIAYLAREGVLVAYQVLGSVIYVLFNAGLFAALFLGRLNPTGLRRALDTIAWAANSVARRLHRPDILPPDWGAKNQADFTRAANSLVTRRSILQRAVVVALIAQLVNLVTLEFIALAYREPLPVGAVLAAFALEAVFSVVTIVPNGLIVAEAVMITVFTSVNVPVENAILITIVYRGMSVWLPLVVGFFFLRYVRTFGGSGGLGGN